MSPEDPSKRLDEVRAKLAGVPDPLALLEGFFAHSPIALQVYRSDGHSLLTNAAFRDLFGSEPPPDYNVLEDDVAEKSGILGLIRRAFAGEAIHVPPTWYDPRELKRVEVKEGRRVAIDATFFPLRDAAGKISHIAIVFEDVTAELEARDAAERERDLLRAIIDQIGDGVIVADPKGVVREFNAAAQTQHGIPKQAVSAPDWPRVYGLRSLEGAPLPLDETPLYRALRGERVEGARWRVARPDGDERILTGTATPVRRADGTIVAAVVTTRDETERLRLEEDVKRANAFQEEFTAVLGHDLRTPLSAIAMATSLLFRKGGLDEAQHRAIARIATSAERMGRLIRDLLDFTRTRAGGGLPIEPAACDLRAVASNVVAELELVHPERTIALVCEGDATGEWDQDRVAQAVSNLIGNALEHSAADSRVEVRVKADEGHVTFSVHNTGAIAESVLPHIFEPFRRGRQSPTRGLGLGLYIVKKIADAHGGSAAVRASAGPGARVAQTLPRRAPGAR